jgi:hypothetical protein
MEVNGQLHVPAASSPVTNSGIYLIEDWGAQSRFGRFEEQRTLLSLLAFETWIVHPIISSLYPADYPSSMCSWGGKINTIWLRSWFSFSHTFLMR